MIRILRDSITDFDGDVIVNAAKPSLMGGGGVDGVIHRAAGSGLLLACCQIQVVAKESLFRCTGCSWKGNPDGFPTGPCPECGARMENTPRVSFRGPHAALMSNDIRCPTGEARITPGFNLRARTVVHTVGPVYAQHTPEQAGELLASAYRSSCQLAVDCGFQTIAFPAISCGIYGFPIPQAAKIAVETCLEFKGMLQVSFYLFDEECYRSWSLFLETLQ